MVRWFPWVVSQLGSVICFGLVLTRVGTPALVEGSARLWMLLGLAWVASLLLGVGLIRSFQAIWSPLDQSWPWYRLGGVMLGLSGLLGGVCTAMAMAWASSQIGQIAYARDRPDQTLMMDMERVGDMLERDCEVRQASPETMDELVARILENEVPLHYTWIENESWMDPWGHAFYYGREPGLSAHHCGMILYSFGPNGLDEFRGGDDIVWIREPLDVTDL
jgi:hypothetical protein